MNSNKPTLYLIRGVPGSGKSTLANTLLEMKVVWHVFEADQFFYDADGNYNFDFEKLSLAHSICQNKTMFSLALGYSVAVSNTSTTEKEVETYRKIAEKCKAEFVSIIVENRHDCANVHNVPEDKIQQMKNRFSIKL